MEPRVQGLTHATFDERGNVVASDLHQSYHEAGHALVAEVIGRRVSLITIRSDGAGPRVELEDKSTNPELCPVMFGGYLSIEYAMGQDSQPEPMAKIKRPGCGKDCCGASQCAGEYWRRLRGWKALGGTDVDFINSLFAQISERYAWCLVCHHWENIAGLAEELVEEKELDGDACRSVLRLPTEEELGKPTAKLFADSLSDVSQMPWTA